MCQSVTRTMRFIVLALIMILKCHSFGMHLTAPLFQTLAKVTLVLSGVDKSELESVFDRNWQTEQVTFNKGDFARMDESDDSRFYSTNRFVEHIDEKAVKALTRYHDNLLREVKLSSADQLTILDLCSSWTSHISPSSVPTNGNYRFVGLGMNSAELERNQLLTERITQDLNSNPHLPFASNSFDIVLLQLSIDYLTRPIEVLSEASRVLRPGGQVVVSFSNRIFIDKCIALWSGKPDIIHIETVGDFLKSSKGFTMPPVALDLMISASGDPLFIVSASKP